ncbi:MAG: tRNA 5-hydroxyuridine modification protein YegQ [Chromatiales bacterium]|nr:tRNA 5-hydroxyuridine modification protein YegQ [Chromatiales bacterium]
MKSPELLAPAGNLRNLEYAIRYGADAVYAGMPRYSLRVRNNDFSTLEQLKTGIDIVHRAGKEFFLASNLLPHNSKVKTYIDDVTPIIELKPDALIMADPGLIMMVREKWPDLPIHLSVQANTMNSAAVKFWHSMGVKRVILSRELSLDEVAEIRQECPEMEIEVFVHGALCIAYSGRCLLSGYFNHRDANQGSCTNSCRWDYKVSDDPENQKAEPQVISGTDIGQRNPLSEQSYLLEEANRPGEMMPIEEDEHGTYIMNSKDLRAIEHINRLVEIGVDSLKIEGRTKSHYYVARTTQIYRKAIDDAVAGHPFDPNSLGELENLANRGYTDGFLVRHHTQEYQNYISNYSGSKKQQFVGEVSSYQPDTGIATIEVKNKFRVGDAIELIMANGNQTIILEQINDMKGNPMDEVPGGGYQVQIPLPVAAEGSYALALLARNLPA